MGKRINARIDKDLTDKVEVLKKRTHQTTTEVLKAAIDAYYEAVVSGESHAEEVFSECGFIGCGHADRDLSETYKESLAGWGGDRGPL